MTVDDVFSPERATYWLIPGRVLFSSITLLGIAGFSYLLAKRLSPLLQGAPDPALTVPWSASPKS